MKKINFAALFIMTSIAMSSPAFAGSNHDHESPQLMRQSATSSVSKNNEESSRAVGSASSENAAEVLKKVEAPEGQIVREPSAEKVVRKIPRHHSGMRNE